MLPLQDDTFACYSLCCCKQMKYMLLKNDATFNSYGVRMRYRKPHYRFFCVIQILRKHITMRRYGRRYGTRYDFTVAAKLHAKGVFTTFLKFLLRQCYYVSAQVSL